MESRSVPSRSNISNLTPSFESAFNPAIEHGTVTVYDVGTWRPCSGAAPAGTKLGLGFDPHPGYGLASWSVVDTNGVPVEVDEYGRFTMPASDVTVSAVFAEIQPIVVESDEATSNKVNYLVLFANSAWLDYPEDFAAALGATVALRVGMESIAIAPDAAVATASGVAVASSVEYSGGGVGGWIVRFTMPDEPVVVTLSTVPADYTELHEGTNEVDVSWSCFSFTPTTTGYYTFETSNGDALGVDVYDAFDDDVSSLPLLAGQKYYLNCIYSYTDVWHGIVVTKTDEAFTTYSIAVDPNLVGGTVKASVTNAPSGNRVCLTPIPATGYVYVDDSIRIISGSATNYVDGSDGEAFYFWMPDSDVTVTAQFTRSLVVGDNAINIAGINQTGDNPPDKVFYFVPPESGTYRFQMPVAQNCMFFVARLKVYSTIAAESPDLDAGGFDFTVALNGGETYRFDINYVFDPLSTTLTITAPQPQVVYPTYLDGANDLVKSNYVAWAAKYGPDTDGTHEAAFLLNIAPSTAIPDGAALLKVVDFTITNKVLHLELASDVCDLFQPEDQPIKPYLLCNGLLTLEIADGLGAFAENPDGSVQKIVIPAPVEIDSSGHAVVDLKLGDFTLPAALFVRPALVVKVFIPLT